MIGMRPTMALMPSDRDVRKAPVIYKAAFCYIFFSSVMFLTIGVPLKNHNWNPYRTMGKTHILYRRYFWMGRRPHDELPSIFMALRVDRHLVV